jgi:hypothetical protein
LNLTAFTLLHRSLTDLIPYHADEPTMETEHTSPQLNYHRSLLAIAELIKAIVEEMSEQEIEQSSSQQHFRDEFQPLHFKHTEQPLPRQGWRITVCRTTR